MEAVSAVHEDPVCVSCGEYSEDGGYLCDKCQDSEDDRITEDLEECALRCRGKVHHATEESAEEHVSSLVADGYDGAYAYECDHDCQSWDEDQNPYGRHWHVASSPTPRKWREWVGES